jgi:hypothetical protein
MSSLLGKACSEREDAAKSLVKIYEVRGACLEFISCILDAEINSTSDPNTLFRANSIASKVIDVYMKFIGKGILEQVLGPTVRTIIASGKSCEVSVDNIDSQRLILLL